MTEVVVIVVVGTGVVTWGGSEEWRDINTAESGATFKVATLNDNIYGLLTIFGQLSPQRMPCRLSIDSLCHCSQLLQNFAALSSSSRGRIEEHHIMSRRQWLFC
jgi:hypothetical protein